MHQVRTSVATSSSKLIQSSDHDDSSTANSTLREVILDQKSAHQKGTEWQSKNLEMGFTQCLHYKLSE